jgi:hypothetical protein
MNLTNLLVFAISLCVACAQECLPFLSGQSTPADQLDIGTYYLIILRLSGYQIFWQASPIELLQCDSADC